MNSRKSRVTGQLTDGSRGSRVKKCDPLSSLTWSAKMRPIATDVAWSACLCVCWSQPRAEPIETYHF